MSRGKVTDARKLELDQMEQVMSTATGRKVLYRQLQHAGLDRLSYAGSTNDTMFNEGRRHEALFLQSEMLAASRHFYFEMMKENTNASN